MIIYKEIKFKAEPFSYHLNINSSLTLVGEDSGTGKTYLFSYLSQIHLIPKYDKTVCYNYLTRNLLEEIQKCVNKFIVIDNADILLTAEIRKHIFFDNKNQYLIFGRDCTGLNVCLKDIKKLKRDVDNFITFEEVYQHDLRYGWLIADGRSS